ncbi:DUF4865 family protein [Streptomyces goshikiensis]|uniref:DUF4865 family protein n=1 Tax=Streptomyces goshikiensis TaxID=1942 RepID=UPI00367DB1AD
MKDDHGAQTVHGIPGAVGMTLYFTLENADETELRALAEERTALYEGYPGLLLKAFVFDPETGRYGSHFIWRDAAAADAFLAGETLQQMADKFGHAPEVRKLNVLALVADKGSGIV